MAINLNLRGSKAAQYRAFGDALVFGIGEPEYVKQCCDEFYNRMAMITRVRDPEVSRYNLESLRNGTLNFITTRNTDNV